MQITPPGSLLLPQGELLDDVRARLRERNPELLESLDPTHPVWIMLQEAAWMVESLSAQLDDYPYAIIRQFAHLLGAELRPALPSLGVVVAAATSSGKLDLEQDPSRWRFFTPQSEGHGLLEFSILDREAHVHPGVVLGITRLVDGALWVAGESAGQHAWIGAPRRSLAFARESVRYSVLASDAAKVEESMLAAAAKLEEERRVGWLRLSVSRDQDLVHLDAVIDPTGAFDKTVPGLTIGGDVIGRWGSVDDSNWTPPVHVSDSALLPPRLRGSRPLPGAAAGQILVPDVPPSVHASDLLTRDARPAPLEVIQAVWTTLANVDTRLQPMRPTISRTVTPTSDEPSWVAAALQGDAWRRLADGPDQTVAHIDLLEVATAPRRVRFAWVFERGQRPRVRVFGRHDTAGVLPEPLQFRVAWEIRLPDPDGTGIVEVVAFEVDVPAQVGELLVTADGAPRGVLFNALLVANAPVVRDGRTVSIQRNVPEPATLVFQNIVTRSVLERLASQGLSPSATALLRSLPIAHFPVDGHEPVTDFNGVQVDPSNGHLLLNAPDDLGVTRRLRRGDVVRMDWYRRTDADQGNVHAGAIRLVEQSPSTSPRLSGVLNPLPTAFGAARESDEDAVQRMFGPQMGVPVTPADWERQIRQALGTRAQGWLVRCWSHAERTLVSTALWPPPDPAHADAETERVANAVRRAGPGTLLVALGTTDSLLSPADLEWAQQVVEGMVAAWRKRLPVVDGAIVTRVWPLKLVAASREELALPCWSIRGVRGRLVDATGRASPPPPATLLLNAAIVSVESA